MTYDTHTPKARRAEGETKQTGDGSDDHPDSPAASHKVFEKDLLTVSFKIEYEGVMKAVGSRLIQATCEGPRHAPHMCVCFFRISNNAKQAPSPGTCQNVWFVSVSSPHNNACTERQLLI